MISLTKSFSGLNNRLEPHLIGPTQAADLSNVNIDSQGIKAQNNVGTTVHTGTGTVRSLHKFNGVYIPDTINWQYAEFNGMLYRAAAGQTPQKSSDGTTFYNLGITAPSTNLAGAAGAAGSPNGAYLYKYTFISTFGEESAPSAASSTVTLTSQQGDLTSIDTSLDAQVTQRKIYRTVAGGSRYFFLATIANNTATTYTDNIADGALGSELASDNYAPPGQLEGIVATSFGKLLGWIGTTLYRTEASLPHAWPANSSDVFTESIKAVVPHAGATLVLTTASPYIVTGTGSSTAPFTITNTLSQQACVNRDTAVDMGWAVLYLSPDGVCAHSGIDTKVLSKDFLSESFMATITNTNVEAARFNDRYILFHPDSSTPGYLEYDQRVSPPWKKGTIAANAVHYNKTDDALYVTQTNLVKQWEAGSAATWLYKTGDWVGDTSTTVKHYRRVAIEHTGTVTAKVYVDGTQVGSTQTLVRSTLGRSTFFVPQGSFGQRVSVEVGGTGTVIEILVESQDMTQDLGA